MFVQENLKDKQRLFIFNQTRELFKVSFDVSSLINILNINNLKSN